MSKLLTVVFLFTLLWFQSGFSQNRSCGEIFEKNKVSSFANSSLKVPWQTGKELGLTETDLLDRVAAVHVTDYMPFNGVVRAGDSPSSFRPEVHFALGEVVRSHPDGLWEKKPIAVLTKLRRLEPQLLNVMTYDTFIFGDFKLTAEDYLIVPLADANKAPSGVNIVTYDPNLKTIRQAVDELVAQLNWLPIRGKNGMGRIHHPANLRGRNVNTPDFFLPLLAHNPRISFGGHGKSMVGEAAAFGYLDLRWLAKQKFGEGIATNASTKDLELDFDLAKIALEKVDKIAASFPRQFQDAFRRQRARLMRSINLASADLNLRKQQGRSIRIGGHGFSAKELLENAESPERLDRYLQSIASTIPKIKTQEPSITYHTIEDLTFLSLSEFEAIVAKHPHVFSQAEEGYARLAYGLERFLIIGFSRARDEGILSLIEKAARSVMQLEPPFFFQEVFKTYFTNEHFSTESSKLNDVLKLFALPSMRQFLAAKMNFNLPPKSTLSLQDVLTAHPKTREAYKPYPASFTDPRIARFLRAVPNGSWRGIDYSPLIHDEYGLAAEQIRQSSLSRFKDHEGPVLPPFEDFTIAEAAANARHSATSDPFAVERYLQEIPAHVLPVPSPRGFPTINDSILMSLRHQPEELDKMWTKLGLHPEFRQRFPTDDDFWKSETPLFQIYLELLH